MRSRSYNPHAMVRNNRDNFKPEAKIYSKDEYINLTPFQKIQIHELKLICGWLDGCTHPPRFTINERTGGVKPTSQLVSNIRAATSSIINISLTPPPHMAGDSISGVGNGISSVQVGSSFRRAGKRYPSSNNSTISSITVNGISYHGPVFDDRGNRLN